MLATLWFTTGDALPEAWRDRVLDAAREVVDADPLRDFAGAAAPHDRVLLLRVLAPGVEPAFALPTQVRAAWRRTAWDLDAPPPRICRT